jgi:hypothetical protein
MCADESEFETGPDDPGYLINTLAIADQVTSAVPAGMPLSWRRTTYRAVLSAILHDAVEHSTQGLEPDDVENLSRFVRNAARAAAGVGLEYRDDAYEILLGALLEDWVDNWSLSGADESEAAVSPGGTSG